MSDFFPIRRLGSIVWSIAFAALVVLPVHGLAQGGSAPGAACKAVCSLLSIPRGWKSEPAGLHSRVWKGLFPHKVTAWLFLDPLPTQKGTETLSQVAYQAEDAVVFDAANNLLELRGGSVLESDSMKLEAARISLHLSDRTLTAVGVRDAHDRWIGRPIFTFKEQKQGKYGKEGTPISRTFFMESIRYNIDTRRALVHKLSSKQEEALMQIEQTKKQDEETFYARDLTYTTCGLRKPHFYLRTNKAKMIQDQCITSAPFRFYFDGVPTPLGFFFGTLFLEGKRTHGILPPELGEEDANGFYLRNGGYYIRFNDYVDLSLIGSVYSNGAAEFKNELRYKKRYLYSGKLGYSQSRQKKEQGWAATLTHTTLSRRDRSLNAQANFRNKSYRTLDKEAAPASLQPGATSKKTNQSVGSLTYKDSLVGFPYQLTLRAKYEENLLSNFKHSTLPEGTLQATWHPFREITRQRLPWVQNLTLAHTIDFESHFKNAEKDPRGLYAIGTPAAGADEVPQTAAWNLYAENGVLHTLPLSLETKLFEYVNATPKCTYSEAWYWKKLVFEEGSTEPMQVPGFHRVYSWSTGATLDTTLYHMRHFGEDKQIQAMRITTTPSVGITHTPDFTAKKHAFFQEIANERGEIEKKYAFEGFLPKKTLANRATLVLDLKLENKVELKLHNRLDPTQQAEQKPKERSRKVFLFKNLDVDAKYDFKAATCRFTEGINLHMASEAKVGSWGQVDLDWTANFDPYLSKVSTLDNGLLKEEPIPAFAWDNGRYLGKVNKSRFKVGLELAASKGSSSASEKRKTLWDTDDSLASKLEEKQQPVDFETPWSLGGEFHWTYDRLHTYKLGEPAHKMERCATFQGSLTLVQKWKLSGRSTYNFSQKKFDPSATEISIQRDLHCWQMRYEWHPLGDQAKYDFSLGVKANVLKILKLPRKRSYNKL